MKKLSIEEKAKAYDEALARANELIKVMTNIGGDAKVDDIQYIFPELKESEDERMMNQLHSWMKEFGGAEEYTEKVYLWLKGLLEKQGENNMGISEATKQKLEDNLNKALEKETPESWNEFLEKQGEQKPADKYEPMSLDEAIEHCKEKSCGNNACALEHKQLEKWLTELKKLKEQKSAEWSEADENTINNICDFIQGHTNFAEEAKEDAVRFLKFLKDRVQPQSKQEWSEEDKNMLQSILDEYKSMPTEKRNWLKSLRPQNWKPSESHLKALEDAMNKYHGSYSATLCQLYGELEKLK